MVWATYFTLITNGSTALAGLAGDVCILASESQPQLLLSQPESRQWNSQHCSLISNSDVKTVLCGPQYHVN